MKIRDSQATQKGDKTETTIPSGALEIIGEHGKTLFRVALNDGRLVISAWGRIRINGRIFDDAINVCPLASNAVLIGRNLETL